MAEQDHDNEREITSEENLIDEDQLELSLALRPINPRPQNAAICSQILSKRGVQALRRFQAKKKRDLKRKANNNGEVEDERLSKGARLNASYWSPPLWWSWNSPPAVVSGGGFRPYRGQNCQIGKNVDEMNGDNRQSISTGSSSGVSDNHQSISGPGGNTSSADAISHSSQSHPQLPSPNTQTPSNSPIQPCNSQPDLQPSSSTPNTHLQPHLSGSSSSHLEHLTNSTQTASKSPKSTTSLDKSPSLTSQCSILREPIGKPPRPNGQTTQQKLMLSQMPCVSATGNGPNGKTITGFLYKYTKSEVSIVCVCHGASFSPAGFVEHAGGVDVEHPLKHIRVVPFDLG